MRLPRWLVWLCAVDGCVFAVAWIRQTLLQAAGVQSSWALPACVYGAGGFGLVLVVYGLVVLTRGRREYQHRAVICILCTFIPGIAMLVDLLSKIGDPV